MGELGISLFLIVFYGFSILRYRSSLACFDHRPSSPESWITSVIFYKQSHSVWFGDYLKVNLK